MGKRKRTVRRSERQEHPGSEQASAESAPSVGLTPKVLGVLFALTVGVRLLYFITANGPSFDHPLIDADYYDYVGTRLASGEGFPPGPFWQPPLYPAALGGLYGMLGHSLWWPRLIQAACDGLTAVLAARIAFAWFRQRSWALTAGGIVAFHGTLLFYSGEILPTTIGVTATTVAIWLATKAPTLRRAVGCGASIGVAALAVATSAVLVLPLAWFFGRTRRRWGGAALAATLAIVSVATVSNHRRSGDWIPISANGGINLHLGNARDSSRLVAVRPGAAWESLVNEPAERGIDSPSGQDGYFVRKALRWCTSEPARCMGGLLWKARLLLRSREIPRNESIEVVREQSPVLQVLLARAGSAALPHVLLLPLAAAGLVAAFRSKRREALVVCWSAIAMAAVPILFFVTGRYRTGLAAVLAVLAASGVRVLWLERQRAWREMAAAAAVLTFAVLPAPQPVDEVNYEAEMYYAVGGRQARLGDDAGAIASWKRAVALRPDYMEARFNLGMAHMRLEQWREAADAFREVLILAPDEPRARVLLSECERRVPEG